MGRKYVLPGVAATEAILHNVEQQMAQFRARQAEWKALHEAAYADPDRAAAALRRYLDGEPTPQPLALVHALARRADEGDSARSAELTELTALFADRYEHIRPVPGTVTGWNGLPRIACARAASSPAAARLCALMDMVVPGIAQRRPLWLDLLLSDEADNPEPWRSLYGIAKLDPAYRSGRLERRMKKLDKKLGKL